MANIKITGYAELAAPISTDLVEVVSDPGGTPISKKVQIRNLFKGGGQIAFPATAVPSADPNTLDDWEVGNFTTTITCETSGSYVLGVDTLAYTKNGRIVHTQGRATIASESSPNGRLKIALPFTSAVLAEEADIATIFFILRDHGDAGIENPVLQITSNTAYATFRNLLDTGTLEDIDETRVDTAFSVYINFTYVAG